MSASSRGSDSTALTRFSGDHYYAKSKFPSFFHDQFYIYGPDEESVRFFVEQKAFKLKEAIKVYSDESKQNVCLEIQARDVMDFSGTYDVETPDGEYVGALRRKGMKSLVRDEWEILDSRDQVMGKVQEDSTAKALMRRFLSDLIPQTFHVEIDGEQVGIFEQRFWPFSPRYDIDFSIDEHDRLDPRLGVASIVLLLAIEGEQD